jgi:uncharacterized protein
VRPLYLRASGGRIPALNRVIVAYKDQIVMEPTLDAALARIFGSDGAGARRPTTTSTSTSTPAVASDAGDRQAAPAASPARAEAAPIERALLHYDRAMQAQRDGNWALYGEEIRLLGETLRGVPK